MNEYRERRQRIINKMEDNSILILFSGMAKKSSADATYPFVGNRNFYYLTGIDQENSVLMIIKSHGDEITYLFIEDKDETKEKWLGLRMSFDEAKLISNISNVLLVTSFDAKLNTILSDNGNEYGDISNIYLDLESELKIAEQKSTVQLKDEFLAKYPNRNVLDIYPEIIKLRNIKSQKEVANIVEAIKITETGIQKMMSISKPGLYEYNLKNAFEYEIKEARSSLAFPTIVASGKNGYILHYPNAADQIEDNSLVLIDLGATYGNYCADISRTFPANGRFTDLQKTIYTIVLECNKAVINYVRPGLTLKEVNIFARDFMAAECIAKGLIKDKEEISRVYYHSVSHQLGLDTHDPDLDRRQGILQPGMVITVEPGLYFKELNIGVRVEDDVLITEDGSECLSSDIIKEINDIEAVMRGNI